MRGITEPLLWMYGLPMWSLSFHPFDRVFCKETVLDFDEIQFVSFLSYRSSLGKKSKNVLLRP